MHVDGCELARRHTGTVDRRLRCTVGLGSAVGAAVVVGSMLLDGDTSGSSAVLASADERALLPHDLATACHVGSAALVTRVARSVGITRARVASVRAGCERHALAAVAALRRQPSAERSRILCYHSTGTPSWSVNDLSPKRFARQIEWARREGWSFADPIKVAAGETDARTLAITFDDGLASVTNVAPLLEDNGIPWTLFVVTDWMDDAATDDRFLSWDQVGELAASGVSIASHSVTHPNFARIGSTEAEEELGRSRELLATRLGIETDEFAVPLGQSSHWSEGLQSAATSAGYRLVYAQAEDTRTMGTVPRTFITKWDNAWIFGAALRGTFDGWEEWA
jgi:peptidoglycan/xylan/chitin deacetylase (PgdA/CDA1 family)